MLSAVNLDDDTPPPDILVSSISANTSEDRVNEDRVSAVFTVRLLGQPTAAISSWLIPDNLTEGAMRTAELLFTTGNAASVQTVVVRAKTMSSQTVTTALP